jgi:hypothetical protein
MEPNSFRGRGSLIFEDAAAFLGRETKKTVSQRKAVFSSSYFFHNFYCEEVVAFVFSWTSTLFSARHGPAVNCGWQGKTD